MGISGGRTSGNKTVTRLCLRRDDRPSVLVWKGGVKRMKLSAVKHFPPELSCLVTGRQRKTFRIARKLCDVSRGLPSGADAAFFLRNIGRFERVRAGRSPFRPNVTPDYTAALQ